MYSSSTVNDIVGSIIDGAQNALVAYSDIFLLMGGLVLAFVIMEYLSTLFFTSKGDTMESNRDSEIIR